MPVFELSSYPLYWDDRKALGIRPDTRITPEYIGITLRRQLLKAKGKGDAAKAAELTDAAERLIEAHEHPKPVHVVPEGDADPLPDRPATVDTLTVPERHLKALRGRRLCSAGLAGCDAPAGHTVRAGLAHGLAAG